MAVVTIVPSILLSQQCLRAEARDLYKQCITDPAADATTNQLYDLTCLTYLGAWIDGFAVASTWPQAKALCLPNDGVSGELAKAILVKWLVKHQSELKNGVTSRLAVLAALAEEYPCNSSRR